MLINFAATSREREPGMVKRPFEQNEYEDRLRKTRLAMAQLDLTALVVSDPSNMAWLTGYDAWSFYVHQAVIVFLDRDPVWWGRAQDASGARQMVWMPDDHVHAYAEHYIQTPDAHPMEDLAVVLSDYGCSSGSIGVEMDNYYFSARAMQVLRHHLKGAKWDDATSLVNWQRAVKSPAEIALMRQAARISEVVVSKTTERMEPGMAKNILVAEIFRDAILGTEDMWGDYPAIVPLLPSGPSAAAPHLTWDGAPLREGEATTIEIAGCVRRYHAPLCRTVMLGPVPDDMRRAEAAVLEGLDAGINAARAGNRAADVAHALNGALAKAGITRTARCGYPIGLSYPPDWGERTMSFRASDDTVLEPGMTFHFMPGLWMDNWGLSITESILITDDGPAETLCNLPRRLIAKA